MGKKSAVAATPIAESSELTLNEKILAECHRLYVDKDKGLVEMGKSVGLQLMAPRRKIVVMLIGNHSAGKSSFINWYIEHNVQKTGVAIETQGFTLVTSGKKRETLTGKATLHLYPHFKALEKIKGVIDYLSTEICPSKAKKFNLVTFVDTPGLVDGEMHYPYDVEKSILWLGNMADQIFVFFDPIGQALCRRTINLVEKINSSHSEKIHFYLSKADEAGCESDRQKVMMQIVQELCKRPGLNKCGFEMPTIYIPDNELIRKTQCVNQVSTVCSQIEKAINSTIQNTLNSLEKDCDQVTELIVAKIATDDMKRSQNLRATFKGIFWLVLALTFPLLNFLASIQTNLRIYLSEPMAIAINTYLHPVTGFWSIIPKDYHSQTYLFLIVLTLIFIGLAWYTSRLSITLSRKEKKALLDRREYIRDVIKPKKSQLYSRYLSEIVSGQELDSIF